MAADPGKPRAPLHRSPLAIAVVSVGVVAAVFAFGPGRVAGSDHGAPAAMPSSSVSASVPASSAAVTSAPPAVGKGSPTWAPTTPDPKVTSEATAPSPLPVSVAIPSIGVGSNLIKLATDPATGALVPPVRYDIAGWFAGGPVPGDLGPAVIAGHVDSRAGPGVFFRLKEVTVGAKIFVTLRGGKVVTFVAVKVSDYPKTGFPTADVYGATPDAQLRLITCGGVFNYNTRSYLDNIVVFAKRV